MSFQPQLSLIEQDDSTVTINLFVKIDDWDRAYAFLKILIDTLDVELDKDRNATE